MNREKILAVLNYEFKEINFPLFSRRLSSVDKANFYGQMFILLTSGIEVHQALKIYSLENTKKKFEFLARLNKALHSGKTLAEGLAQTRLFTSYEIQSVAIGEETGRLTMIFSRLSKYFENKKKLRQQFVGIMIYPVAIFSLTGGVVYFMLSNVVPKFEDVFRQFNQELPRLTEIIISLSNNLGTIVTVFFLVILLGIGGYISLKSNEKFRLAFSFFLLKIPLFGPLLRLTYLATFMEIFALLCAARVPLVQSLTHLEATIWFYPLKQVASRTIKDVSNGYPLIDSFKKFSIFGPRILSQIQIAEQVNELDKMLEIISSQLENELEHRAKIIGKLIEPLIILVVGTIVGFIMVAMYLPLFNLSQIMI